MTTPRGSAPLRLHQRCELTSYGQGEILFVGQTSFSHGIWVGVALDDPKGKNDGIVQGKRYFTTGPNQGIFIRPSQVHPLEEDEEGIASHNSYKDDVPTRLFANPSQRPSGVGSRTVSPSKTGASIPSSRSISPVKRSSTQSRASLSRPSSQNVSSMRQQAPSPQKAATTSSRQSPLKTPARMPASAPASRTGSSAATPRLSATSSRSSAASPALSTIRNTRPSSTTPARTPAASVTRTRASIEASKVADTSTARSALRPVAKTRSSMAPPQTPARTALTTAKTPSATGRRSIAATSQRPPSGAPRSVTARTTPGNTARYGTGQQGKEAEEEGDLMDVQPDLDASSEGDWSGEQLDSGDPTSPSLRKAEKPDHMSLSKGPSMTNILKSSSDFNAIQRELEELRVRLRISESKREEDRNKIREAERIQQESEQVLAARPKLLSKQQELQEQLKDLHKLERDWGYQKEEYERQIAELNDNVEIITLDKEVADEKAEAIAEELQTLKDRVEELELDLEVQREENARYEGDGNADHNDRTSVAYIQMEKQNERLKEALVRLRDLTAETDAEQKQKLADQEKELRALDEIQASYESVCAKLEASDTLLEDLKVQLDDALGAEEMLEQLTERNMVLSEKVTEKEIIIEELESLKELNDELEETHIETEKQLQEELDLKEMQLREHQVRNESLEANLVDYEGTFSQFRELVLNLQSEVESLKNDEKARDASKATTEAGDQAMLNLNLKLQSSSLKSQAKTIELELGKLEASQASQQLDMTAVYLPKRYFDQDKDAVESLLFFLRISSKTEIIKNVIENNHDIAGSLVGVVEERLINICRMRHSLAHFIASSRQISALLQLSSIPTFLKSGRMFKELISVEKRIDAYIDLLRREELKEDECAQEYRRFVKMLEDFEFALLDGSSEAIDSDLAAKEQGSAILLDLDLDTIAAALGNSKQSIASLYNEYNRQMGDNGQEGTVPSAAPDFEMRMDGLNIEENLFVPLQELINNIRSTKVPARKLVRRLTTLYENKEAVKMEAIMKLPGLGKSSSQLVAYASTLATTLGAYASNVRVNKAPFDLREVLTINMEAANEALHVPKNDVQRVFPTVLEETVHLSQTVTELLSAATEQDNVHPIHGTMPWVGRVEEIREEQANNAESQRLVSKQAEDLRDLYKQIKARDEVIEELRIKIERLVKQLQKSRQDNEAVDKLREELSETTKRMKAYEEGNAALQVELEQMQQRYEQALGESAGKTSKETGKDAETAISSGARIFSGTLGAHVPPGNYEVSYLLDQLEALQGVVRYLRSENSLLKGRDLFFKMDSLPTIALPPPKAASGVQDKDLVSDDPQRGLPKSKKEARAGSHNASHIQQKEARLHVENKRLWAEWMQMASSPKVVLLPPNSDSTARRSWVPMSQQPHVQFQTQLQQRRRLEQKIHALSAKSVVKPLHT